MKLLYVVSMEKAGTGHGSVWTGECLAWVLETLLGYKPSNQLACDLCCPIYKLFFFSVLCL